MGLTINEVGRLPNLREYGGFDIDRLPDVFYQWVHAFADDINLGRRLVRDHSAALPGLWAPGFFVPQPCASLAEPANEAGAIAVASRLPEHDFPVPRRKTNARVLKETSLSEKHGQVDT